MVVRRIPDAVGLANWNPSDEYASYISLGERKTAGLASAAQDARTFCSNTLPPGLPRGDSATGLTRRGRNSHARPVAGTCDKASRCVGSFLPAHSRARQLRHNVALAPILRHFVAPASWPYTARPWSEHGRGGQSLLRASSGAERALLGCPEHHRHRVGVALGGCDANVMARFGEKNDRAIAS